MARFQLTEANEKRVIEAVQQIYEKHGIQISANRLANIAVEMLDCIEFRQEIVLTLKTHPTNEKPSAPPKPKKRIQRSVSWMAGFR